MRRRAAVAVVLIGLGVSAAPEVRAVEPTGSTYLAPVTTITPPKGCVVLTPGMNGVKVRMVQQRLGLPDSAWETMDTRTREAVMRFQKRNGLTVDGVVGPKTWAAMGFVEDFCMDRWTATPVLGLDAPATKRIGTMIRFARNYLGGEYVWGGAGKPKYGIDCSGLVLQGLYRAGLDPQPITVDKHVRPAYRTSRELYEHSRLQHFPFAQRQRGDLIFYRSNETGKVNHVGIYLGNGRILEAVSGPDTTRIGTVTRLRYGQTVMPTVVRPFV